VNSRCPIPARDHGASPLDLAIWSGTAITRAASSAGSILPAAKSRSGHRPSGPKSNPYGIVFTKGALWYNEPGAKPNTIVRFDPATEKFQSWAIPGGGDIVRNMDVNRDGNPVMANSLVNQIGIVEVKGATN
jgi:streptogramin lyase